MVAKTRTAKTRTATTAKHPEAIKLSPACSEFLFDGASCFDVLQLLTDDNRQRFLQEVKAFHGVDTPDEELEQVDDYGNANELLTDERADEIIESLGDEDREAHDAIIAELEEALATPA